MSYQVEQRHKSAENIILNCTALSRSKILTYSQNVYILDTYTEGNVKYHVDIIQSTYNTRDDVLHETDNRTNDFLNSTY